VTSCLKNDEKREKNRFMAGIIKKSAWIVFEENVKMKMLILKHCRLGGMDIAY